MYVYCKYHLESSPGLLSYNPLSQPIKLSVTSKIKSYLELFLLIRFHFSKNFENIKAWRAHQNMRHAISK